MGSLSPVHWLLAIAVIGLLFGGRGKLSSIMGDAAKGIRAFKDGLKDEDHPAAATPPGQITPPPPITSTTVDREDVRR